MSKSNKAEAGAIVLSHLLTTVSNRALYQAEKGVGLNAAALFVSRKIEVNALAATVKAVADKSLLWSDGEAVLIVKGNKGETARFGRISKCNGFFEAIGSSGAKGVVSLALLAGIEGASMEVVSVQTLAKRVAKNTAHTFTRSHDSMIFAGRIIGASIAGDVCGMVYGDKSGRIMVIDIETDKNNAHNVKARGSIGGEAAEKLELTDSALAMVASGEGRKGAVKAAKVKAKK